MFWKEDRIGRKEGGKKEEKEGKQEERRKESRIMNELMEVGLKGKVFLTSGSILLFLFHLIFFFLIGGQLLYNILSHQKNMIH